MRVEIRCSGGFSISYLASRSCHFSDSISWYGCGNFKMMQFLGLNLVGAKLIVLSVHRSNNIDVFLKCTCISMFTYHVLDEAYQKAEQQNQLYYHSQKVDIHIYHLQYS